MSKISLTVTGLENDMTSDEVKQKLAQLYNIPEKHFDELCKSLFIKKEPYVLLKKVDQAEADAHIKRLEKIGLNSKTGKIANQLSLVPVSEQNEEKEVNCPACEQLAGDSEVCQHCGVIMQKYLKQKQFDEQFQQGLKSTNYSQERMQQQYKEQSLKKKEIDLAKRKVPKRETPTEEEAQPEAETIEEKITVITQEKSSKKIYACVASVCVGIIGVGVVMYGVINSGNTDDELLAASSSKASANTLVSLESFEDQTKLNVGNAAQNDETVPVVLSAFDSRLQRQTELKNFKNQLGSMYEKNRFFSAVALTSGKEDLRDRIFGKQELVRLEGMTEETSKKLQETHILTFQLDNQIDRIDSLLNQSDIYSAFELHKEADEAYDEAASIARETINDSESRVLAETALAEHHLRYGDQETARQCYKIARENATNLPLLADLNSAYMYVAHSEASHGLAEDAKATNNKITDIELRESSIAQIQMLSDDGQAMRKPELAAGHMQIDSGSSDNSEISDISELVEMTEQNRRKFKAASQLLGK